MKNSNLLWLCAALVFSLVSFIAGNHCGKWDAYNAYSHRSIVENTFEYDEGRKESVKETILIIRGQKCEILPWYDKTDRTLLDRIFLGYPPIRIIEKKRVVLPPMQHFELAPEKPKLKGDGKEKDLPDGKDWI